MPARRRARRGRRALLVLVVVLLVVVAALPVIGVATVRASFPQTDGQVTVPGLSEPVTVLRDEWGVPQIYAATDEDLFFAQGYVHAQDRFYEMDFRRHVTAGRLAEMFGAAQVPTDRFLRTLGWRRVARAELDILAPGTVRSLRAYSAGVNTWLADHRGAEASLEYAILDLQGDYTPAPWTPVDSISWLKAMAWDLRTNIEDEIDRALLAARLPADQLAELYPPYPYGRHRPIVASLPARLTAQPTRVPAQPSAAGVPAQPSAAGVPAQPSTAPATEPVAAVRESSAAQVRAASTALVRLSQQVAAVDAVLTAAGGGRDAGIGSNAWAVTGSRTASGRPLLANDPHLAPAMPSVWYQVGLHCTHRSARCPYDVAGFSFSGLPGVIIGHNDRLGWGFTNLGPDVADLYLEKVDGDTVEYNGHRVPLTKRTERIDVAGGKSVTMTVRSTRHGPLVSGVDATFRSVGRRAPAPPGSPPASPGSPPRGGGYAVALSWTALTPGHTADAIFAMDAARSWPQFRRAARFFEVPAQNLVYADRDGHIGYQAPGTIPIRRTGTGDLPAPGWDPRYDWAGTIPYDELPSVLDPPEGYVVTANQAVTPPSYRYHLTSDWDYGYRSQRIVDLLERTRRPLGAADMARIQADTRNPIAPVLVPALLAPGVTVDARTARARDLLTGWDFTQPEDSAAAAYHNAVWRALLADTFHDQLPQSSWPDGASRWYAVIEELLARPDSPWWDDTRTPAREHRDDILARALREAQVTLTRRLGADPAGWRWGQLHQLDLVNASLGTSGVAPIEALFNRGPVPVAGGAGAVDATSWDPSAGFAVTAVPSMRMIVDMADLDASRWVNLTGASGHAYSDHYGDQIPRWRARTTTPWPFTPGAIERAAVDRLVLRPE